MPSMGYLLIEPVSECLLYAQHEALGLIQFSLVYWEQ